MMRKLLKILVFAIGGVIASILLAVAYYFIFSLVVPTDVERRLKEENASMRREIPRIKYMSAMVKDEITYLEQRDRSIYRSVFKTDAPEISSIIEGMSLPEDIASGRTIVTQNWKRVLEVIRRADSVEMAWRKIYDTLQKTNYRVPPAISPVNDLDHSKIGASIGSKMSPFYKVQMPHGGLDIISPAGTPVLATAPGVVTLVRRSEGGRGNMVEITHPDGFLTRYAHLEGICVYQGQWVARGAKIAVVGDSGRAFTTHLHYEVQKDGTILDPCGFMYCSVTPEEYINMLIMSMLSGQSLD